MGGSSNQSAQPQIPRALQSLYKGAGRTLGGVSDELFGEYERVRGRGFMAPDAWQRTGGAADLAGFGMFDLDIDPAQAELMAMEYAQRYAGDADVDARLRSIILGRGDADYDAVLRPIEARERERLGADIREQVGSRAGSMFNRGLLQEVSTAFTDLAERGQLMRLQARERALDRSLNASQVLDSRNRFNISALLESGGRLRGIEEANLNRMYQDYIMRKFQMPLEIAKTQAGVASNAQLYQPTYGPSKMAGFLGGAASGAAIGTSISPGWGTAIGAVGGGIIGAMG